MPIHTLFARWRAVTLIRLMAWLAIYVIRQRRKRRLRTRARPRKFWSRHILAGRKEQGNYRNLDRELQLYNREFYFKRVLFLFGKTFQNSHEKRTSSYFHTFLSFSKTSISACLTIFLFVFIALAPASPWFTRQKNREARARKTKNFLFLVLALAFASPRFTGLVFHLRLLHTCQPALCDF